MKLCKHSRLEEQSRDLSLILMNECAALKLAASTSEAYLDTLVVCNGQTIDCGDWYCLYSRIKIPQHVFKNGRADKQIVTDST
jgi:hypothetical protein